MQRVLWWVLGGGRFLMSEVPLYLCLGLFRRTNMVGPGSVPHQSGRTLTVTAHPLENGVAANPSGAAPEMCSGSEAGSYLRLIDFACHSTLGLRVIKKKKRGTRCRAGCRCRTSRPGETLSRGASWGRARHTTATPDFIVPRIELPRSELISEECVDFIVPRSGLGPRSSHDTDT